MKIAFIGTKGMNFDADSFGGFETVITELAPRLVKKGYSVTIYCRKKLYSSRNFPSEIKGVKLKFLTSIETKNFGTLSNSFLAVLNTIRNKSDIAFLFNLGLGLFIPLLKLFKIKIVTNLDGVEWERSKWSLLAKMIFKVGAYLNVKFADYLIADANEIAKIYVNKFNIKPEVIPYGAEIRDDLGSEGIANYNLKPNDYFLLATRFIPENNPLFVIESFLKSNIDKPLVVLGRNYYKSDYENSLKSISDKRILFLGHITNRKLLLEFYKNCYLYIHAHSVGGTNPTMLEALANSSCILALDTVFNREMLSNGEYGIFFQLHEDDFIKKIRYLYNNPKIVQDFKKKSSKRIVSYYNWELVTEKYTKLLNRLQTI